MRFNNSKNIKLIPIVYFFIIVSMGLFLFLSVELQHIYKGEFVFFLLTFILLLIIVYLYKSGKYFEYDSDGETLCLTNRGVLISEKYNYREQKAEFPKYKLKSYKVSNYFFFKYLSVKVMSKNSNSVKKIKFNITFISNNKIKVLQKSLQKIVHQNKHR